MTLLRKISQRSVDPLFYEKWARRLIRRFRRFDDTPRLDDLSALASVRKATVVIAHPDDETFCSGLVCALKEGGAVVQVLCLTKGEGGPNGKIPRERLGEIRAAEMERSCAELGVDELVFLDHLDPEPKGFRMYAPAVAPAELGRRIRPFLESADLVVTHGSNGEYWHPGHLLVFKAAKAALPAEEKEGPAWITFLARNPDHPLPRLLNWDDAAFLRIDVSRHHETRRRALECHGSQLGLFGRFAKGTHEDFIRQTAVETYALRRPGRLFAGLSENRSRDRGSG